MEVLWSPGHNTEVVLIAAAIEFFLRGEDYYYGHGVGQDYKGRRVVLQAGRQKKGTPGPLASLGYMYRDGLGVERSWNEAQKWFQKGRTD